jgi:hypothetical protein
MSEVADILHHATVVDRGHRIRHRQQAGKSTAERRRRACCEGFGILAARFSEMRPHVIEARYQEMPRA